MWVCRDVGFRGCGGQWSVWSRVPRVWFWHPGAWSPKGVGCVCGGGWRYRDLGMQGVWGLGFHGLWGSKGEGVWGFRSCGV